MINLDKCSEKSTTCNNIYDKTCLKNKPKDENLNV